MLRRVYCVVLVIVQQGPGEQGAPGGGLNFLLITSKDDFDASVAAGRPRRAGGSTARIPYSRAAGSRRRLRTLKTRNRRRALRLPRALLRAPPGRASETSGIAPLTQAPRRTKHTGAPVCAGDTTLSLPTAN